LSTKLYAATDEMLEAEKPICGDGAFSRLVGFGAGGPHPALRCDDVDFLEFGAELPPLPFLPAAIRHVVYDPDMLFPSGVGRIASFMACHESHRGDRVALALRMLRSGLIGQAALCADTFFIGKRDTFRLRKIWSDNTITRVAAKAPKPPLLASPAALSILESSDEGPIRAVGMPRYSSISLRSRN
jgi:hypothetical protein